MTSTQKKTRQAAEIHWGRCGLIIGCRIDRVASSPNMYALIGGNVIDIPRLDPECGVPFINIAGGADGAKGAGRMWVAHHLIAQVVVPGLAAPGLRPA